MLWINTLLLALAVLVFFLVPWPWYYAAPLALGVLIALGVISGIVRALVMINRRRWGP